MDLNHFKPYNDQYGYWKGDEMLKGAAAILHANLRSHAGFPGPCGRGLGDFLVLYQSPDWSPRNARARHDCAFQSCITREMYAAAPTARPAASMAKIAAGGP
ncbi:GGDEF domain-containing protein [Cupriavidus basilensis]